MGFKSILATTAILLIHHQQHNDWFIDAFSAQVQTPSSPSTTRGANVVEAGAPAPSGVQTTARKRTGGRKSFLHKQSHNTLTPTITPEELHNLGLSLSKRKRGSHSYNKGWIRWRASALDSIRSHLSQNLPHTANKTKFENLFFRLGVASDLGQMPSFEDPGARSGYALEFFCRARNLADLYMAGLNPHFNFPESWVDGLMETPMLGGNYCRVPNNVGLDGEREKYSMVSLGGGPGFDFVSAALASSFCSYTSTSEDSLHNNAIKATVLDYETGWGDLVEAMGNSTQHVLQNSALECDWGGKCDITKSIFDPSNTACLSVLNTTNLWTCQYCVAENANRLQESKYVFFRELFEHAQPGALFVLSEVHPRIWPNFYHLMEEHCPYMQVGFNKHGRQMLLRKCTEAEGQSQVLISEKDGKLIEKFEELGRYHERKINSGYKRQAPKRRGEQRVWESATA